MTGVDAQQAWEPTSAYRQSMNQMNDLVRKGVSFSGHERNCVYLNTGKEYFADISAISGLDFADDGRAHALTDWDGDGDVDLWTANRNAPQLRFMRNDLRGANNFVAVRLQGTLCNRDAIGARVEVVLDDQHELKLVKALRAGEGFLGQSSKWLHFGLGGQSRIERLLIHWPGQRRPQVVTDVRANRFYRITQNRNVPREVIQQRQINLKPSIIQPAKRTSGGRVAVAARVPTPALEYRTFDGRPATFDEYFGTPLLINLWAAWCEPCLAELNMFTDQRQDLRAAGLNIVALSVDEITTPVNSAARNAREKISNINFPFASGMATPKIVEILQYLSDLRLSQHRTMPLPCSVLLDPEGRIAVIYRGTVAAEELLKDVEKLSLDDSAWTRYAQPFPGRWKARPGGPNDIVVPLYLIRKGYITETLSFVNRFDESLSVDKEYPRLLVWLGDELFKKGMFKEGLGQYEQALRHDPNYVPAMNNLAWKRAAHPDPSVRDADKALHWAQRAASATHHTNPAVLDTLAAAMAESGRFSDAVATARNALRIARQQRQSELVESIEKNLSKYEHGNTIAQDTN